MKERDVTEKAKINLKEIWMLWIKAASSTTDESSFHPVRNTVDSPEPAQTEGKTGDQS